MEDVWEEVNRRATGYIQRAPWSIKDYGTEEETAEGTKPKRKKGAKKERADVLYQEMNDGKFTRDEIIEVFMTELDMSKPGATTYFHDRKKRFGFKGPKPDRKVRRAEKKNVERITKIKAKKAKKKGKSKGAVAEEVYLSMPGYVKSVVLEAIIKATGTSPAGANTYYCAAKKKHG